MSKKPEKAAPKVEAKSEAPADSHAPEAAAEGGESAENAKDKVKAGGKDSAKAKAPSIEEAIQLALATAETTADASSEVTKWSPANCSWFFSMKEKPKPCTRPKSAVTSQREAIETFQERNEALYESSYRSQFISGIIQPSMNFIANLNYVAIAVIGGVRVASGQMSLGDVQAFIQYSRQFTMPIVQTASIANVLQSTAASADSTSKWAGTISSASTDRPAVSSASR